MRGARMVAREGNCNGPTRNHAGSADSVRIFACQGHILGNAELRPVLHAEQIMQMPGTRPERFTIDDVERLVRQRAGVVPRYELVHGELLVTPAPSGRHQRIVFHLALALQGYLSREKIGEIRLGPAEMRLSPDVRFEPDLFVVPAIDGRLPDADGPAAHPPSSPPPRCPTNGGRRSRDPAPRDSARADRSASQLAGAPIQFGRAASPAKVW